MSDEVVEIPLLLENVLRYSLNDARKRMEEGQEIIPFTALAVGETLFMEEHDGASPDECFASARKAVAKAQGARAYGLCYDGYVDAETGRRDALIAQGGMPGEPYGHAIGLLYKYDDEGKPVFNAEPIYVGPASNYMCFVAPLDDEDEEEEEKGEGEATE